MTLEQLEILKAVVNEGSFRAAADKLWKTQPAVSIAVKKLEKEFKITLFDRKNYRATLTPQGKAFYEKALNIIRESDQLKEFGKFLASETEPYLGISINVISPLPQILNFLKDFFEKHPNTQPKIAFDILSGSMEKLLEKTVDFALTTEPEKGTSFESIYICETELIPVASPGYLPLDSKNSINDKGLKKFPQIIVSDSARKQDNRQYGVLPGGRQWTVNDMNIKKELLLAGMGWGSLPGYMIEKEIEKGLLTPVKNKTVARIPMSIHAVRLKNSFYGPVAESLWEKLQDFTTE